MSEVKVTRL